MRSAHAHREVAQWAAGLGIAAVVSIPVLAGGEFDPGRVGFEVRFDGLRSDYRVIGLFVLPGQSVRLVFSRPVQAQGPGAPSGSIREWKWTAPAVAGLQVLEVEAARQTMRLHVFVMRPAGEIVDGHLDGYRIGAYPRKPFRGLAAYKPPGGFVAVTPELSEIPVAPHFTLGQFLCKQESGWPKMLFLRTRLVLKLERILEEINHAGIRTDSLVVMSGFRTPWYNASIGNQTSSSRHVFGGAADIYIDVAPQDGVMDDLNRDGHSDKADAAHLYRLIDGLHRASWWQPFVGGLSSYGSTEAHGPFVHVDVRGYRARW